MLSLVMEFSWLVWENEINGEDKSGVEPTPWATFWIWILKTKLNLVTARRLRTETAVSWSQNPFISPHLEHEQSGEFSRFQARVTRVRISLHTLFYYSPLDFSCKTVFEWSEINLNLAISWNKNN